ncbi:hypothetical protein OAM00_03660, partial [Verrucomicrobia bacterium]|nr:hypothetical protein [Verrucomicrobiota bacterium]
MYLLGLSPKLNEVYAPLIIQSFFVFRLESTRRVDTAFPEGYFRQFTFPFYKNPPDQQDMNQGPQRKTVKHERQTPSSHNTHRLISGGVRNAPSLVYG